MNWLNLPGIALGLAMDAFAVSIVVGLTLERLTRRHVFRMAFHFGLFQFMMPVLGWLVGKSVAEYICHWDHWAAFALLGIIGGRMLLRSGEESTGNSDPTRGLTLIMLSIATSIDALAVGLSMAFLSVSIWVPSVVIGAVAAARTVIGMRFASIFSRKGSRWAQILGGVVLIAIGIRILISHLTASRTP